MKTNNLFVIVRPDTKKDSMGGDLPGQVYVSSANMHISPNLCKAELFTNGEVAGVLKQARTLNPAFNAISLMDAIKQAETEWILGD